MFGRAARPRSCSDGRIPGPASAVTTSRSSSMCRVKSRTSNVRPCSSSRAGADAEGQGHALERLAVVTEPGCPSSMATEYDPSFFSAS